MNIRLEPWYLEVLSPVVSALIGAMVVYYFGIRQLFLERKHDFREKQLAEFYAPMAGLRKAIRAKSEFRQKLSQLSNRAWKEMVVGESREVAVDGEDRFAPFRKIIDYNNEQLETELMPMYRRMLDLFTERYHLADPETREFYGEFVEFVEIWNRFLAKSLPYEVNELLEHDEGKICPFYDHLEAKVTELQNAIFGRRTGLWSGRRLSIRSHK